MKTTSYVKTVCVALLTPFIALYAQQAEDDDESIFELSPFTIQEDEAIGYQALSTLAGTRIKTDLRDIGAGIQVITQEFLEDTGATDAATLLAYGLNTEILGEQGNYSGHGLGDTRVQRAQPHLGAQRIRGLTSATVTRDFFQTELPFDTYNTTSVTINRGPNAILFGTGNPAGIINNATKQASLAKEFGQVGIRVGERSSYRFTGDYNKVLIEDRLALRFNYLNEDYNFHQEPSYENDKRYTIALTAILAENENSNFLGRTILRGNWEDGRIRASPVRVIPPKDEISDWFDATRHAPVADIIRNLTGVIIPGFVDGTVDPDRPHLSGPFVPKYINNSRVAVVRNTNGNVQGGPFGGGTSMPPRAFVSASAGGMALVYADIDSTEPTIGIPGRPEVQGQFQRVEWHTSECCADLRSRYFSQVSDSMYRNTGAWRRGFEGPVIMNRNVLDNTSVNAAGSMASSFMDFDALNVTLEQQLFDGKGGIELAFDEQSYFNKRRAVYGDWFGLNVDIMAYLPNDQPNPNVGRVHGHAETEQRENFWDRESQRATAFYEFDFTENEGLMSHLGTHILTGLWNEQTIDFLDLDRRGRWDDGITNPSPRTARDVLGGQPLGRGGGRATLLKIYVSDDLRGLSSFDDVRIRAPKGIFPGTDEEFLIMWQDRPGQDPTNLVEQQGAFPNPAGVPDPANWVVGEGDPMYYNNFTHRDVISQVGAVTKQVIDSQSLAWQGRWLGGHVVSLVGWREDKSVTRSQFGQGNDSAGHPLPEQYKVGDPDPAIKGNTTTKSLVAHIPREWIGGDAVGVSLHYNESESFSPRATGRNVRGEILAPPNATTEEFGVTFEFLDRALSLRISKYDMVVSDYTNAGGLDRLVSEFGNGLSEFNWASAWREGFEFEEIIPGGAGNFTSYAQVIEAFANADPVRHLNNRRYVPALPAEFAIFTVDRINGKTATHEFTSDGTEIELIGNITQNWRLSMNVGEQETITSNTAPVALAVAREYQQNLISAGLWDLPSSPMAETLGGTTVGLVFESDVLASLLNAAARDGTVAGEQVKWRYNITSAYDFLEGPLKGVGVGGAYRWQDRVAIGYEKTFHAETGALIDDINKPFLGESENWFDLFAYYERPFFWWSDKVDWKIQLNVRNAFGTDDYIPVRRNPDGLIAVVRNPPPQDIFLSNTFSF